MSIEKFQRAGWFSLPPLPNGFNIASLYSANSSDGRILFVSDGTLGIFFDCKTLQWGNKFSFPYANNNTHMTGVNTKGNFALYNANITGRIALCNFNGPYFYPAYPIGNCASSIFGGGYENVGYATTGAIFDLQDSSTIFDDYYFMAFSEIVGPVAYIVVGFSLINGTPLIQWNDPQLPFTGVYSGPMKGCIATQSPNGLIGALSYNNGLVSYPINSVTTYLLWLLGANAIGNINEFSTIWFSDSNDPVPQNNGVYTCPSYNASNYSEYPIDNQTPAGFGQVLGEMVGTIITDNYYVQLNGNELTYVNLTARQIGINNQEKFVFWNNGVFNFPLTIETPILNGSNVNPSMGSYNGNFVDYPSTMVNYANTYGFFKPDFSAGWILGIANYELMSYNMSNYTRNRP